MLALPCVITCVIAFVFMLTVKCVFMSLSVEIMLLLSHPLTSGTDHDSLSFIGAAWKRHLSSSGYNRAKGQMNE